MKKFVGFKWVYKSNKFEPARHYRQYGFWFYNTKLMPITLCSIQITEKQYKEYTNE